MKKIGIFLLAIIIGFTLNPNSSYASVKLISSPTFGYYDIYEIRDEFDTVEVAVGTRGDFSMKTPSGSTKIVLTEGNGRNIDRADISVLGGVDPNNYLTVTFGDGFIKKYSDPNLGTTIGLANELQAHPSKGIIAVLHTNGTKKKWAKLRLVQYLKSGTPVPPVTSPDPEPDPPTTPDPSIGRLDVTFSDPVLSWGLMPSNADYIKIFKNGVLVTSLNAMENSYDISSLGSGKYSVYGFDSSGNILTSGSYQATVTPDPIDPVDPDPVDPNVPVDPVDPDPPDPTCPAGCQAVIDALDCPEFDEYLGKWADMIKTTYPPPPNWDEVAGTMRDKIVPAMGQEIVNRSPEIAKIIADELQSREKSVEPPRPIGTYTPPETLPMLQDIPQVLPFEVGDTSNDFVPDYTESKPFSIPDPADVKLSDTDSGYAYPLKTNDNSPDYKSETKIDPDKGYQGKPSVDTSSPTYSVTNPIVNESGPEYYYINGGQTQIPIYKKKDTTVTSPDYTTNVSGDKVPDYKP